MQFLLKFPKLLFLATCYGSFAFAQVAALADPDSRFEEGWLGEAQVSSAGVLVGFSIGSHVDWQDNKVPFLVPEGYDGEVCLRSTSLDGRFWSFNPFRVQQRKASAVLGPISKSYLVALKKLSPDALTFRVSTKVADGCSDLREAVFLPVLGADGNATSFLINSSDRQAFARLRFKDGNYSEIQSCDHIDDVIPIAADKKCAFEALSSGGPASLELVLLGVSATPEKLNYQVILPSK